MSDYPMLISNKLHSFRNFALQRYIINNKKVLQPAVEFIKAMGVQAHLVDGAATPTGIIPLTIVLPARYFLL